MKNRMWDSRTTSVRNVEQWSAHEGVRQLQSETVLVSANGTETRPLTKGETLDILCGDKPLKNTKDLPPEQKISARPTAIANAKGKNVSPMTSAQATLGKVIADKGLTPHIKDQAWELSVRRGFEVFEKLPEPFREKILKGEWVHPGAVRIVPTSADSIPDQTSGQTKI